MTEQEWLVSKSPVAMLRHLRADPCDRKVLLYASHLCYQHSELLTDPLKAWAELVEELLILISQEESADVIFDSYTGAVQTNAADEAQHLADHSPPQSRAYYSALADVVSFTWDQEPEEYETDIPAHLLDPVRRACAAVIRDLYGNPFRPVTFSPSWRTDTALALARTMYEAREFGAMPILADALQDAGCDSDDILNHCRDAAQVHVRGCWVCDMVLGKE